MTTLATNEKGRASRAPAGAQQRRQAYASARELSTPFRGIPGRHAHGWDSGLTDALALLLLGLQRDDLTICQKRRGWKLAECWLGEFVEARLARGAA